MGDRRCSWRHGLLGGARKPILINEQQVKNIILSYTLYSPELQVNKEGLTADRIAGSVGASSGFGISLKWRSLMSLPLKIMNSYVSFRGGMCF